MANQNGAYKKIITQLCRRNQTKACAHERASAVNKVINHTLETNYDDNAEY